MNRSLLVKMIRPLVAFAGVAVLGAVVAMAQDAGNAAGQNQNQAQSQPAAPQGPRTDGQIEMDVVHALDASAALKNDLITAATIEGEVTLSGTVSTQASKQLAESIAAHVDGVTKVHNNLTIGNPGADAQNQQPAPDTQEMPDANQTPAQQQMANLPPPGPDPNQAANQAPNQGQPQNESQAQAPAPNPQQGAYPPPPPQRPQYQQGPQYSQYPPQYGPQYGPGPAAPSYTPASGPVTLAP